MNQRNPDIRFQSKYTMKHTDGGYQYTFYCAYCDFHYTTGWIRAESTEEAYRLAEKEAKKSGFNGCQGCGKWSCDNHYNMAELMCINCAPPNKNKEVFRYGK
jgi:hypothetical protein